MAEAYQSEFLYTVDANVTALRYKFWVEALNSDDPKVTARAEMTPQS